MKKIFALIDCNSFYCSCERVFRADLKTKPIVVLSNNDGCVIARTQEAKNMGIPMGVPFFQIHELYKQNKIEVFSSNFSLYTDLSQRVMSILKKECPSVQVYSIDEAFVELTGLHDPLSFAYKLKKIIYQKVGIPVSIGIAPTKVLAKRANHIAKNENHNQGVFSLLQNEDINVALKQTNIIDVWGVGKSLGQRLSSLKINTAYDFKTYANEKLIQREFTKVGLKLKHELMGISCIELLDPYQEKKEISHSRSFGQKTYHKKDLQEALANFISTAAARLRTQSSLCTEVSIYLKTDFLTLYEKKKLINATHDTRLLIQAALQSLEKIYLPQKRYKKAGVRLSGLHSSNELQLNFFDNTNLLKQDRLMQTIDKINHLKGKNSIQFGVCGLNNKTWSMKQNFKSPCYTTNWEELPYFF